jgi:hypothetical protein
MNIVSEIKIKQSKIMIKYLVSILFFLLFENHSVAQNKEKVVTIHQPQNFRLASKGRTFIGGNATIVLDVKLPANTVKWYYTFGATRDNDRVQQTQNQLKLVSQLIKIVDVSGTAANALNLLSGPPGEDFCNLYLFSSQGDANQFDKDLSLDSWNYNRQGSRPNYRSGIVEINDPNHCSGTQYIGIDNPSGFYGISCAIEVVAIVKEEESVNGWTASRKDEIFNMFKSVGEKMCSNLAEGNKFRFASCGTKKLTTEYTDVTIKSLGDHEVLELVAKLCLKCNEELNLECDLNSSNSLEVIGDDLIGRWKGENCIIALSPNGKMFLKFDWESISSEGSWTLQGKYFSTSINNRTDDYEIIEFKKNTLKYKSVKNGSVFSATKIEY